MYGKQGGVLHPDSIAPRINIIAQGVINIGMLSMMKTLQLFKRERAVIDRERKGKQYSSFEYLVAKFLAELPFDALVAFTFGSILHHKTQLRQKASTFVTVCSILGLGK